MKMKFAVLILFFTAINAKPHISRCANLGSDDCANGYLPDAGTDDDYLGSGATPGKRHVNPAELQKSAAHLFRLLLARAAKRCANLGTDDCANGYLPDAGDDDDYLKGKNNPGKRCANLGSDDCANGYLPDAGDDDDYLKGGDTPGKRCANLGSDDCANGYLPGAGDDDDYLGSGNTPGKRCANLGSDDCANGYLPGAGDDDDYLGSGNTPGKRYVPKYNFRKQYLAYRRKMQQ